jgi:nucleoside-diphosphate-sugar epimerase
MRVLVTGAAGFVGGFLCRRLLEGGHAVRAAVRDPADRARLPAGCDIAAFELHAPQVAESLVRGVDAVVHLAAKVHEMTRGDYASYDAANTQASVRLARAAAGAGAATFVFASTIKVNGEATAPGAPFTAADPPRPQDPYAQSKWRAEEALQALASQTGLRLVVVRPPLVYGPGVRGNFLRLLRLVARGVPLPLGSARNRRSLLYVENLADLLERCLHAPRAAVLLAADGEPVSTRQLVIEMAQALGRKARLLPFPQRLLVAAARLAGRGAEIERLLGSLEVDMSGTLDALAWRPPFGRTQALKATADWFARCSTR